MTQACPLRCTRLTKWYRRAATKVAAVAEVSLQLTRGEVFGLLGPNGAGKTTLVRMLSTILTPSSGCAEVGGFDVRSQGAEVRRVIGYGGQDTERSAYPRLTAEENLLYFAHALHGVSIAAARTRISELANRLSFTDKMHREFSTLSGGEKQLVVVMRAFVNQPRVVFLDEPGKGLDPIAAEGVRRFIRSYSADNRTTFLLTTHNLLDVEAMCDRVAFMRNGKLQFVGTPDQFRAVVKVRQCIEIEVVPHAGLARELAAVTGAQVVSDARKTMIYCSSAVDVLPEVCTIVRSAGLRVPIRIVEPSLEDAYSVHMAGDRDEDARE